MKKVKRKYTRKPTQVALQSITATTEVASDTLIPVKFGFDDLPASIRTQAENIIAWRKKKGLPDDSKERKELAVKYFVGDRLR
jgi:hypothetical protein